MRSSHPERRTDHRTGQASTPATVRYDSSPRFDCPPARPMPPNERPSSFPYSPGTREPSAGSAAMSETLDHQERHNSATFRL